MPVLEDFSERMKRLSVEDPKAARVLFLEAFEANGLELEAFLVRLRRPNEGRLRQVVANAVRTHPAKGRLVSDLTMWRETETDEFTRRALESALAGVDVTTVKGGAQLQGFLPNGAAETYRYVSSRVRHRLRNAMLAAQVYATRLATFPSADPDAQETAAKLNDAMKLLGRELEATDVDPGHFRLRSIALADWIRQLNRRYAEQYSPVDLRVTGADNPTIRVSANDYLLETVFWNIWLNAHQATGSHCQMTIEFEVIASDVVLLVLDNGDGFSRDVQDLAFQQEYSTKDKGGGAGRGRGLLEIQDAVERLGGRVELRETATRGFRIQIRLPMEK
jgi:signal transduction histidine kinase